VKISVALCTYNGAKYLRPQLQSLAAQTLLPAELVVCDDGSSDSTISLVEEFAAAAPFAVRSFRNDHNVGSTQNFARAVSLCSGDIIALCDQDDVWHSGKLERVAAVFENPAVGAVFSDARLVDAEGESLGKLLWENVGFDAGAQRQFAAGPFAALLERNIVTGATLAFRSSYLDWLLPIPDGPLIHDAWIALLMAAVAEVKFLPEPLIDYRQHAAQQVGALEVRRDAVLGRGHYRGQMAQLEVLLQRLQARDDLQRDAMQLKATLPSRIAHLRQRSQLPRNKLLRLPVVLRELFSGRYHRFSSGTRSAARDLWF
jgi:glycosyltransferase involved in cell wall biosynthesis